MNELIAISPSSQRGNKCAACYSENAHCTALARMLAERLHAMGYRTMIVTDEGMSNRVAKAKKAGASLYLPLHTNAYNRKVRGSRFGYFPGKAKNKSACLAFVARWRQIYTGGTIATAQYTFTEAWRPTMPTVYVELVFHDNPDDAAWLHRNMDLAAAGLSQCCDDVIKLRLGSSDTVTPPTGSKDLTGKICVVQTKYDQGLSLWGTRSRKNVRSITMPDGQKTIYISKGQQVKVVKDYKDGWVIAQYMGVKGLADAQYLKPV